MRSLLLLAFLALTSLPAWACKLDPLERPERLADFARDAFDCLNTPPRGYRFAPDIESDFIGLVNETRLAAGLPMLDHRAELTLAARYHSLDMAANRFFSHEGPNGRGHDDRIAALDRRLLWRAARENLAQLDGRADNVAVLLHESLMNSPGHRANILADNVDHIAVGVVRRGRSVLVTQLFVAEAGALSANAPLELGPGDPFYPFAQLEQFSFKQYRADAGEVQLPFDSRRGRWLAPDDLNGDFVLEVRGEAPTDRPNVTTYIYFRGPGISSAGG